MPKLQPTNAICSAISAELDGRLPADPKEWDNEKYKFFHFGGDDGIGYLFICENECQAAFLWQCT